MFNLKNCSLTLIKLASHPLDQRLCVDTAQVPPPSLTAVAYGHYVENVTNAYPPNISNFQLCFSFSILLIISNNSKTLVIISVVGSCLQLRSSCAGLIIHLVLYCEYWWRVQVNFICDIGFQRQVFNGRALLNITYA